MPTLGAHGLAFARDGGVHVLAGQREVAGPLPQAHVLEHGAVGDGPVVRSAWCERDRTACRGSGPRKRAEGHRRVGRPEGRRADLRHGLVERLGDEAQRGHVGGLALVGRHAGGGVALDVLDRLEALAHGEPDVLGGDVVLQIDEGAAPPRPSQSRQHARRGGSRLGVALAAKRARACRPAAAAPAAQPSSRQAASSIGAPARRRPSARPARRRPARRRRVAASKRSFPRDCENRCTAGVQPPDMPTQSQVSVRRAPIAADAPTGATIRPVTRLRPTRAEDGVPGQDLAAGSRARPRPPRRNRPPGAGRRASPRGRPPSGRQRPCRRRRRTSRSRRAAPAPRRSG